MAANPSTARGEHPRSNSVLSGGSKKSHRSWRSNSSNKIDLTENSAEKPRLMNASKADPSQAINEAQPAAVALERSNLGDLRKMSFKDTYGNEIVEPDLSNPTRYRFERPLDTIRSFEAAKYKNDSVRPYEGRPVTPGNMYANSRRNSGYSAWNVNEGSSYGGYGGDRRDSRAGYYRNSGYGFPGRPDSTYDNYMPPNQPNQHSNQHSYQRPRPGRYASEGPSGPYGGGIREDGNYSSPEPMSPAAYGGHKASYDTMGSATPEGGSEGRAPYSTNPTTANSSFDHVPGKPVDNGYGMSQMPVDNYGMNGFGDSNFQPGPFSPPAYGSKPLPAEPRKVIKLGGDGAPPLDSSAVQPVASPSSPGKKKRQSWLSRRFSKNG